MDLLSELREYSDSVIAGKIVACQKHRWACERFLCDLERAGCADFPYVFQPEKAARFFRWMGLFKHRKGVLKGKYIEPHIIQKFVFGNIYGWIDVNTGYRRFSKLYWQVARKNAKSQSLAAVASYELMAFDESGVEVNEVYCAATKREQAMIIYDETAAMLRGCDVLKGKWKESYGRIRHIKTGSFMRALSEEDKRTGDGLNPKCGVIDEYHAHDTSEIYDVIDSGMGARAEPLMAIITTAGFDLTYPCYRVEYDYVARILDPDNPIRNESYFAMVNELDKDEKGELVDSIKDETAWAKANPIICSYPEGVAYLRRKQVEAIDAEEKLRNFLTKHMNVWVQMDECSYMSLARWGACCGEIPELSGRECIVGLDLSAKIDLCSVAFEFRIGELYIVESHSFMPAEVVATRERVDRVPYAQWVRDGWISTVPGATIDYRFIRAWVEERAKGAGYYIAEWCLDPWGGHQISGELADAGETVVEIIQGIKTLSEPTKDFREMVYSGRVRHNGNPVLTWALGNAIADEVDRNRNLILNKKKSKQRIDPAAACINAHVRAMVYPWDAGPPRVLFV